MRLLPLSLLALCSLSGSDARIHHAFAQDLFAFPKYRVSFLNGLPVLNETARRWLDHGLSGGEAEFLDQPWQVNNNEQASRLLKGIEGGDKSDPGREPIDADHQPRLTLQHMRLSPKSSYICLIPPAIEFSAREPEEDLHKEVTPSHSWSLLQPLSGSCLYHRQGWFTYAYCHNKHVRQFRELAHTHPHPRGNYEPEEDPVWEAYTLGQAAASPQAEGRELTQAQQAALARNVDIARSAGHRYLVQKWGHGTMCDKTSKPREIEVQFHCSMTMADTILFVKETKTCHYVMVINTPRLCGEPGFRTRLEQREETFIRCREVLDSEDAVNAVDRSLPEAPHPYKRNKPRNPILGVPPPPVIEKDAGKSASAASKKTADVIRRALEALMSADDGTFYEDDETSVRVEKAGDGQIWVELVDADGDLDQLEGQLETMLSEAKGNLAKNQESSNQDENLDDDNDESDPRSRADRSRTAEDVHDEL